MALVHGGQLQRVAQQYNIPLEKWLDLSTGIAPLSYPVANIPLALWQQLPQQNNALNIAAKAYYQSEHVLSTNGSQAIIKSLPALWRKHQPSSQRVFLPSRGYKEHAQAWQESGYQLSYYDDELPPLKALTAHCVLVVINPNNPTGKLFSKALLVEYQKTITDLAGLLVVDEAFIDVISAEQSMCSSVHNDHTLVLRSFGKFFGLAGIRIGFLIANAYWLNIFSGFLGPWQVNGPAQFIAEQALQDTPWQQQQRKALAQLREQQETLLWNTLGTDIIREINGTNLFLTLSFYQPNMAKSLDHLLSQQGVYVRLADEEDTLRFGITTLYHQPKLASALATVRQAISSDF